MGVVDAANTEIRLAWRGIRARGWQAVLVIALLGIALGANTVLFSAADAFVFNRAPHPNGPRLVVLSRQASVGPAADEFTAAEIREWRRQTDLFDAVHAYTFALSIYVTWDGLTEPIAAQRITPGLFEMIGVFPAWGRPLSPEDAMKGAPPVAVISEELAVRLFGSPARAIGGRLPTVDRTEVVGVMREDFRFPTAAERVWLPLDLDGVQYVARNLARLPRAVPFERAAAGVRARMDGIAEAGPRLRMGPVTLMTLAEVNGNNRFRGVFIALIAAGGCLLLIACANVASLELAAAVRRTRTGAIQAALGAGRAAIVRQRGLEALILLGLSLIAGTGIFVVGSRLLTAAVPPLMARQLSSAIDLDGRAMFVMVAAAAAAWIAAALPVAIRAVRFDLVAVLRDDARTMPASASTIRIRQLLVVGQVATAVVLTVGALLYARTYAARAGLDKGFESSTIATLEVYPAPDAPLNAEARNEVFLAVLRSHPAIESFARSSNLLPSTISGVTAQLRINGVPVGESVKLTNYSVEPSYFATMGIPLTDGRVFGASDMPTSLVIDETFARRYWGSASPVGSTFDMEGSGFNGLGLFTVIGVASSVRVDADRTERNEPLYVIYSPIGFRITSGVVARLKARDSLPAVVASLRERLPRSWIRADLLDDRYARLEGDRRLAAWTMVGLSSVAIGIAFLGVYAVMSFVVSTRAREMAIRVALGAEHREIRVSVLRSACGMATAGALIGAVLARIVAQFLESQLYGVSPADPLTYVVAIGGASLAGIAAGWVPARNATKGDPAVTLRSL